MSRLLVHFALFFLCLGGTWLLSFPCCSPQFVNQFEQEIPKLRAEVGQLQVQIQDPREVVFADVLLRRPKYVISAAVLALPGTVPLTPGAGSIMPVAC